MKSNYALFILLFCKFPPIEFACKELWKRAIYSIKKQNYIKLTTNKTNGKQLKLKRHLFLMFLNTQLNNYFLLVIYATLKGKTHGRLHLRLIHKVCSKNFSGIIKNNLKISLNLYDFNRNNCLLFLSRAHALMFLKYLEFLQDQEG